MSLSLDELVQAGVWIILAFGGNHPVESSFLLQSDNIPSDLNAFKHIEKIFRRRLQNNECSPL